MMSTQLLRQLCVYASVASVAIASAGCDNGGTSGGGTGAHTTTTGNTGTALTCTNNFCMYGAGGYAFTYADSDPPMGMGTSTATLHTDGSLCIDGHLMALPPSPTQTDSSNDWGLGLGINLNQAMAMGTGTGGAKMPFQLTGTGVTVNIEGVPSCETFGVRVVVDQMGAMPEYCAGLTATTLGKEIPWSAFNTQCWNGMGTSLTAAPNSEAVKIQFVTGATACDFKDFCITELNIK
jgi:hypothetical protein